MSRGNGAPWPTAHPQNLRIRFCLSLNLAEPFLKLRSWIGEPKRQGLDNFGPSRVTKGRSLIASGAIEVGEMLT
jgi:hypothetical protein